ncbi:hypothetical protein AAFF_G00077340 [Aldrovandia affinis]|uniref:Scinderin n=1 Tax=Aldrovandia affinis TaxID=143900 RepID=A0AAD7VX04_9TELE|nr:hypothetical protein AAFF_G00077340 [Aldrovandia affinis]
MALQYQDFKEVRVYPGLQVWRVEGTTLTRVPESLYGSFYMGDAYMVLHTHDGVSYSLHYWLGKKCSQNESGAAAIFTVKMVDHLGGKAVQYRELQGFESITFTSYFKQRITYQAGGAASEFQHVVTNDMSVQRLFHVKGRRVVRALEVPLAWASFNRGDCFIADFGEVIYQWCGSMSNRFERQKAGQVGAGIRDNERNCRAELIVVEEGAEPLGMTEILGNKPDLPDGDGSDDAMADISNRKMAKLLMVSDMTGSMQVSMVGEENPLSQTQLQSEACFILDHGTTQIFVWKGRKANLTERKEAMKAAECYIKQMDYPANTKVYIFRDWKENEGFGKVFITEWIAKIQQEEFDASKLHESRHMAAQYNMVDDGSGRTQVWRVENSKRVPVDPDTYGQFYGGDCYIILYTYPKGQIIYTWYVKRTPLTFDYE